jgi:hypothetical protein
MVLTNVSGQPVDTIFKSQVVVFNCLTPEDGADMLFRNVDRYLYVLCNISEERRSDLYRGGSLNSRTVQSRSALSFVAVSTLIVICINYLKPNDYCMYHTF